MNFQEWLLDEIAMSDRRLGDMKQTSPEWCALAMRINVLQECYERLRHCERRQTSA